jgi:hypothetical protein
MEEISSIYIATPAAIITMFTKQLMSAAEL